MYTINIVLYDTYHLCPVGLGWEQVCSCRHRPGCRHYRRHRHIHLPIEKKNFKHWAIFISAYIRIIKYKKWSMNKEIKTIPSLSVSSWEELMTEGQLSFESWWPSPSLRKRREGMSNKWQNFTHLHTTGHSSGLYLSTLSSQVSPTRSSSESDCRHTKQTLLVRVTRTTDLLDLLPRGHQTCE